ncbi:Disease resistance protein [Melia azedarach]|uniref:Disease resistance protein n=1 Tax=Melia azedarach TaxID=155640 RepID=A0ACC1YJH7_MELAZ|nr:Disease resistance protein [Melia azedarach]
MVAIGEILLAAFLQVLFARLASPYVLNFVRQFKGGLDAKLKKWENTLRTIQDDRSKFTMHDLIHDLAQFVSRETIFRMEDANNLSRRFERVRHSSYSQDMFDGRRKFEDFYKVEQLRTFLPILMRDRHGRSYISYEVLHDLLPRSDSLKEMPLGMNQLTNLQTLSNFILGKGGSVSSLKDLKNLTFLWGKLSISGLENLNELEDAREAELWKKKNLQALSLEWFPFSYAREVAEEGALNMLRPHENIEKLTIRYYGGIEFPPWIGDGSLSNMKMLASLAMRDSQGIETWKEYGAIYLGKARQGLNMVTNHEEVSIGQNCVSLVPFPEVKFLAKNLRSLNIENNGAVKCLPEEMTRNDAQLEQLYVSDCPSLAFIARTQLPSSLKFLHISECQNFQRLVDNEDDASSASSSSSSVTLKILRISYCHKLTTLSSGIQLLGALENLMIAYCQNLGSLPDGLHSLRSLKMITIWKCPSIVSFPQRGLPSNISHVTIWDCENLKALPDDLQKFNSLCDLKIRYCPMIELFPEEGFPTSLTSLVIEDRKMCKAVIQWGLHRLTSLTCLTIGGCHESDEEINGMMLPAS